MTACVNKRKPYASKSGRPNPTVSEACKIDFTLTKQNFLQSAFYENLMGIGAVRTNHTSM